MFSRSALAILAVLSVSCQPTAGTALTAADSLMTDIFVELYLIQARSMLGYEGETISPDSILAHYGMTPEDFDARMEYYAEHPAVYSAMYNQVMDHLGQEIHAVRGY